jgi:hypothetical protein
VPTSKTAKNSPLVEAMVDSRTVRNVLDRDAELGLWMGGPEWYELGPVKADLESRPGAVSFRDFNFVGGGSSASNSVPNELAASSIINYARKRGLSREDAAEHFLRQTGYKNRAPLMGMHMNLGLGAIGRGIFLPSDPMSDAWKIPSYVDKRMGGGGLLDAEAPGGMAALDTHERNRLWQAVLENPRLLKLAKQTGAYDQATSTARRPEDGVLPLRNALDYQSIAGLYTNGAKRFGLPTAGAYQASRWTGGWDQTGLKSPPRGDFVSILEDAIRYSAQQRGMDDSPAGLLKYWDQIARGDEFLLPFYGTGGYPIRR